MAFLLSFIVLWALAARESAWSDAATI